MAGALALPARAPVNEVPVVVDIVAPPVIEEPPPAPPAPPPVKLARHTQVRPVLAAVAPVPPPQAQAANDEPPPEAPAAAVPEAGNESGDMALPAGLAGKGTGTAPGSPNGVPGGHGTGQPSAPPNEAQRKSLVDGYLADMFRTRIQQNFRYPDAARELELTGQVVVQVTVDRQGRLLAARLAGRCRTRCCARTGCGRCARRRRFRRCRPAWVSPSASKYRSSTTSDAGPGRVPRVRSTRFQSQPCVTLDEL